MERGKHGGDRNSSSFQPGNLNDYRQALEENEIAPTTAHRWETIAKIPEDSFEERIETIKATGELTTASLLSRPHVTHNSGNNEWYTPPEYIEAARAVMGSIDLDPATSHKANEIVKADAIYTVDDSGLEYEWFGRAWMNPPYASDLIGRFAEKLCFHVDQGDVTEAIVLVNNATETGWFQTLMSRASAVAFPRGRVRFWNPDDGAGAPLQGQAVIYMGLQPERFREVFGVFGWSASL
jgi:ParB family chromosome partitioning protein